MGVNPSKYKSTLSILLFFNDFKKFATTWTLEVISCGTNNFGNFAKNKVVFSNKDKIVNLLRILTNPFGISILISISFGK